MTEVCSLEPFNYDTVPGPDDPSAVQLAQEQLQGWLKRFLDCVCADITELEGGGGGGGATTFLALSDTPSSYSGQATKSLRVNAGETALEFYTPASAVDNGLTKDYSTSEQTAPRTWFLSSDTIYQKSFSYGAMPNATTKSVNHNITNLDKVLRMEFWMKRDSDGSQASIPHVHNTTIGNQIQCVINGTSIDTRTSANYSAWNGRLTLWYTRT